MAELLNLRPFLSPEDRLALLKQAQELAAVRSSEIRAVPDLIIIRVAWTLLQDLASVFASDIHGSLNHVAGLPLEALRPVLINEAN